MPVTRAYGRRQERIRQDLDYNWTKKIRKNFRLLSNWRILTSFGIPLTLGSVRRECLDHVDILGEQQLRRILKEYVEIYFNRARPHQGLGQAIPVAESRSVSAVSGKVVPFPILGGLHHDYRCTA